MDGDFATSWSQYVNAQLAATGEPTLEQVGDLIGASASMVSNWIKAQGFRQPSADKVLEFWRHFGAKTTLPEAMAAAGYGTVDEYDTVIRTKPDPDLLSLDELFQAQKRKIVEAAESPLVTATRARGVKLNRNRARKDQVRNDAPSL